MRATKNLLIAFFAVALTDVVFAGSGPVTCGSTLAKKKYTLAADLDCSHATAPITVRDRAVLDLNNHVYVGPIVLDGRRAQLRNGTVECILAGTNGGPLDDERCVRVEGEGRHTVQNVLILYRETDGFGIGIWVLSDRNLLIGNTVFQAPSAGVFVIGSKNVLRQNKTIMSEAGFFIDDGNENQLIENYATMHNLGYGIDEGNDNLLMQNVYAGVRDEFSIFDEGFGIGYGAGNRLTRNVVTNEDLGIIMGNLAGPNTIENNIVIRNGVDLADFRGECGVHVWENNIFETSNPPCIGDAAAPLAAMESAAAPVASAEALEKFSALLLKLSQWNPKRGGKTGLK
jgi:hypothetical protein